MSQRPGRAGGDFWGDRVPAGPPNTLWCGTAAVVFCQHPLCRHAASARTQGPSLGSARRLLARRALPHVGGLRRRKPQCDVEAALPSSPCFDGKACAAPLGRCAQLEAGSAGAPCAVDEDCVGEDVPTAMLAPFCASNGFCAAARADTRPFVSFENQCDFDLWIENSSPEVGLLSAALNRNVSYATDEVAAVANDSSLHERATRRQRRPHVRRTGLRYARDADAPAAQQSGAAGAAHL